MVAAVGVNYEEAVSVYRFADDNADFDCHAGTGGHLRLGARRFALQAESIPRGHRRIPKSPR